MAEDNVGGIAVSFTADAAQLQAEINRLETQLKTFNANYGNQKVALQITTPSRRALLDTRREISNAFTARGSAGQIMAQVHVKAPDARALGTFRSQLATDIGAVKVKVVGNFEWGQRPPTSITIPVNGGGGGQRGGNQPATTGGQPTPLAGQRPARPQAAGGPVTTAGSPVVARTRSQPARSTRVTREDLAATWTADDLPSMSTAVLRQEVRGLKGAEKKLLQDEIDRRDIAAVRQAGQRPAARGLTGGMVAAYGYGAPQVLHHGATGQFPRSRSLGVSQPIRDIYDPYAGGPKPGQIGVSDLGSVSQRSLENRLRRIMSRATPEAIQAGTGWYQRAGELVQGIGAGTGRGRMQIAAAAANFSQNASWPENLRNAQDFFTAFKRGARTVDEVNAEVAKIRKGLLTASGTPMQGLGMNARTQRSLDLMQAGGAGDIEKIFGSSPKLNAFWKALMGDPTSFTVDRHQALMMSGRTVAGDQRVHDPFQRAGRKVAAEFGITAADLQAITWVMALGHEIAGADPQAILQRGVGARVAPGPAAGRPVARGLSGQFDPYGRTPMPGEPGFEQFQANQYAAIHGPLQPRPRAQNVTAQVAARDISPPQIIDLAAGKFRSGGATGRRGRFIDEATFNAEMSAYKNRNRTIGQRLPQVMAAEGDLGIEGLGVLGPAHGTPEDMYALTMLEQGDPRRAEAEARYERFGQTGRRRTAKRYPSGFQPAGGGRVGARPTLEQREAALAGSDVLQEGQQARFGFEERLIAARQATTVRAPGTFLAGLISNMFGGARAKELQGQAAQATARFRVEEDKLVGAFTKEYQIQQALHQEEDPVRRKELTGLLHAQYEEVEKLEGGYQRAGAEADKLTAAAQRAAGGGLRNLAAGFVGGLAGGLAFGIGMQALSGAIEGVSQALAPTVARATNFSEVAGETSKNLAATVRQAHGLADVGLANVFQQTGFKGPVAQQLTPDLLQIAQIQAGVSAFKDQQALIQTAFNFRNAQGIPGITASTGGGLFGIGAEKGVFENIKEQLNTLVKEPAGTGSTLLPGGRFIAPAGTAAEAQTAAQEKNAKTLELVNQQLSLFGVSTKKASENQQDLVDTQRAAITALGGPQAGGFADALAGRGLLLTNEAGDVLTGDELKTAIIDGLADLPKASAKSIIDGMRPQIEAQRALFRLQSNFQRQQQLPAQFALQQAAQPLTAAGAGFTGETPRTISGRRIPIPDMFRGQFGGAQSGGVGGQYTAAFESLAPMLDETDQRLMDLREDGQRALEALVPADQIVEFRALNKEITNVGLAISGLQIGVQQEQTNFQVAQYSNQLRIAQRSQTDLLQLTGQLGATQGDNLGLLQRQQIMYERQTQELSLQSNELTLQSNTLSIILAQRQINFQRSLAGFVTPGETPQEIAARAREAELEANFAQKQLDIQKEQLKLSREQQGVATKALPLQFQIQDIGFQRQLTDINAEIALLNQGIQLTVHTAAAERAIAHLTALENELVKKAGTYVDEGTRVAGAFMEGVAQVKAATVDSMDTVLTQTARAWQVFLRQGQVAIGGLVGAFGGGEQTEGKGYYIDPDTGLPLTHPTASGFYGSVNSATQFTVGEAGTETVAILRNPRNFVPPSPKSGGWGSGGGNITVMVTGNQIGGSEQDQERFAAIIARKVEEIQSRRGSLLGLRGI